jgi:hypothetical protein
MKVHAFLVPIPIIFKYYRFAVSSDETKFFYGSGKNAYRFTEGATDVDNVCNVDGLPDATMLYGTIGIDHSNSDIYHPSIKDWGMAYLTNNLYIFNKEGTKYDISFDDYARFSAGIYVVGYNN